MQLLHLCVHLRYRHHLLGCGSNRQVIMLRSEGLGVPLGALEGLGVLLGGSGGLWPQNLLCPKSYYTEQFEKYGYIRDKYDTTYSTPTPYDPSLIKTQFSSSSQRAAFQPFSSSKVPPSQLATNRNMPVKSHRIELLNYILRQSACRA